MRNLITGRNMLFLAWEWERQEILDATDRITIGLSTHPGQFEYVQPRLELGFEKQTFSFSSPQISEVSS